MRWKQKVNDVQPLFVSVSDEETEEVIDTSGDIRLKANLCYQSLWFHHCHPVGGEDILCMDCALEEFTLMFPKSLGMSKLRMEDDCKYFRFCERH